MSRTEGTLPADKHRVFFSFFFFSSFFKLNRVTSELLILKGETVDVVCFRTSDGSGVLSNVPLLLLSNVCGV